MGLYFLLFLVVYTVAALSMVIKHDESYKLLIYVVFSVMTAMLCLRFGQGTDWFVHMRMFYSVKTFNDIFIFFHGEPLFLFICFICNKVMLFHHMVMIISFIQMIMMWKFLRRYSRNIAVSLMIMLMQFYIIYMCSIFRQGIVVTFFFGIGTYLLEQRKYGKYILLFIVLSGIHTVSVIYLLLPFVLLFSVKTWAVIVLMCFVLGVTVIPSILSRIAIFSYIGGQFELLATAERWVTFAVIYIAYRMSCKEKQQHWWMKVYCFGIAFYFLMCTNINVARRTTGCFKALEIIIVTYLITWKSRYRQLVACYFFVLAAVMFWNSVSSEIATSKYRERLNPITYPYVSVFNANDIYNYRESDKINILILPDGKSTK